MVIVVVIIIYVIFAKMTTTTTFIRERTTITLGENMQKAGRWYEVSDTDPHGGLSMLVAVKALQEAGEEVVGYYSHFEPVPRGQAPQRPVTNPAFLAQSLPQIVSPGVVDLMVLDIPVNIQRPLEFIKTVTEYTFGGRDVWFIDHHGHNEYTVELLRNGVTVILQPTSYDMTMYVPRVLGLKNDEYDKWALFGATADYDESVAHRVTLDLEELITEYADTFWKDEMKKMPEIQAYATKHGNIGAFTAYAIERNLDPDDFLRLARERGRPVPLPERYETRGNIVYSLTPPPLGYAWKSASKLCRITGAHIAILVGQSPRGYGVVIAGYWRNKDSVTPIVEEVARRIARGQRPYGHEGARAINCTSLQEAQELVKEAVNIASELMSTMTTRPSATHLIADWKVARYLDNQNQMILTTLAQILQKMNDMYERYLELKERQVKLLEEATERDRRRYD